MNIVSGFPFIVKALEIIQDSELYPERFVSGWEPAAKNDAAHVHALCNFGTTIGVVSLHFYFIE